jgi:hypothetical protein
MVRNEQLISTIIYNLAHGLYSSSSQAVEDLVEAGLSLEDATLNVNAMKTISVIGVTLDVPKLSSYDICPVDTLSNQSCDDRIRQLWVLGYI